MGVVALGGSREGVVGVLRVLWPWERCCVDFVANGREEGGCSGFRGCTEGVLGMRKVLCGCCGHGEGVVWVSRPQVRLYEGVMVWGDDN